MKALCFALACLLPLAAAADVYEWVDKDGRTHYSDTLRPDAKRIPMPEFAPVPPPPSLEGLGGEEVLPPAASSVRIVRPAAEETLHDNTGVVQVEWAAEQSAGVAGFRLILDGRPLPELQTGRSYTFQGVERGTHTVQVTAVDRNGREVAASGVVTFYLWHGSQFMKKGP